MTRALALALFLLLVAVLGVLLVLVRPRPVDSPAPASPGAPRPATTAPAPPATVPLPPAASSSAAPPLPAWPEGEVGVFFEGDDLRLHRETRKVPVPPGAAGRIRAAVDALLRGPETPGLLSPWPAGATSRAVFLAPPGLVTIDLDVAPEATTGWGTHGEWMALQAIAATALGAAPPSAAGAILVTLRGEPIDSLGGHIDLSRPIRPDASLFAAEPEDGEAPGPPGAEGSASPPPPAASPTTAPVAGAPR